MTDGNGVFSGDYFEARARFRAAASEAAARLETHAIEARGPGDAGLTIDVAHLGAAAPVRTVVVSSGLHGVEGFFGSAVQVAWLKACKQSGWAAAPDLKLVLIHALNPFGFAWRRRANEDNVDPNRNFPAVDPRAAGEADRCAAEAVYARLVPLLGPSSPPAAIDLFAAELLVYLWREGMIVGRDLEPATRLPWWRLDRIVARGRTAVGRSVAVGQRTHPRGLFYCGGAPSSATRLIQARFDEWIAGAKHIVHLDLHTALGPWATYKLMLVDTAASETGRWFAQMFGAGLIDPIDTPTHYRARGMMGEYLKDWFRDRQYRFATAEFGTHPAVRVLAALRAENRAHFHAAPGDARYERAKQRLVEACCPSDPSWRNAVVSQAIALIDRALAASEA